MQPRTVRKYLQLMGARYVRTKYVLHHRPDPVAAGFGQNWTASKKRVPPEPVASRAQPGRRELRC